MKVLLVDTVDHLLFLQGLQSVLRSSGIDVAGIALNRPEALSRVHTINPDVIILNISENVRSSLQTLRRIHDAAPLAIIIVFTNSTRQLKAAQRYGASGFLLTRVQGSELLKKLHEMDSKNYAHS